MYSRFVARLIEIGLILLVVITVSAIFWAIIYVAFTLLINAVS